MRRLDPVQQPAREDQDPVGRRLDAKRAAEREVDVVVELCARQPPQQPAKAEQRARTACERQRRSSRSQPVGRARGKPRDIDRNRRCQLALGAPRAAATQGEGGEQGTVEQQQHGADGDLQQLRQAARPILEVAAAQIRHTIRRGTH